MYDGFTFVSIASLGEEIRKRTILVNGLSKSHSMTGWRIGYVAADKDLVAAMNNIQSQSTSNPVSFCDKASVEALNGPQDFQKAWVAEFDRRRRYITDRLNNVVQLILDAGVLHSESSTVIDLTGDQPEIVRRGSGDTSMFEETSP